MTSVCVVFKEIGNEVIDQAFWSQLVSSYHVAFPLTLPFALA